MLFFWAHMIYRAKAGEIWPINTTVTWSGLQLTPISSLTTVYTCPSRINLDSEFQKEVTLRQLRLNLTLHKLSIRRRRNRFEDPKL